MYDVVVIGAGASGMLAAGRAAELGARVLLIEKNAQPGRKLLITGKGRCNITNQAPLSEFMKQIYPNGRFLKHAFGHFAPEDMIALLARLGVKCILERGGRYFPSSEKAAEVVEALKQWLLQGKVELLTNCRVSELIFENGKYSGVLINLAASEHKKAPTSQPGNSPAKQADTGNPALIRSKCLVISTGGKSYPATGSSGDGYEFAKSAGHQIEPIRPSLVPLMTEGDMAQRMQGLSLKNVRTSVWVNDKKVRDDFGEMLFTHFGISGPIILSLSRVVVDHLRLHHQVRISIDLKPALDEQQLDKRLIRDINQNGKKKIRTLFKEWLPSAMIPVFLDETHISPEKEAHQLTSGERKKIAWMMKNLSLNITGHRSFKEAVITAGGINTGEIWPKTMESKKIENLFFSGEVLDLDANTGGFNLQIAWSTGWLAGQSAANKALMPQPPQYP